MSIHPLHRSVAQIERELQAVRTTIRMSDPLPSLDKLEAAFNHKAALVVLDPDNRMEMAAAHTELENGKRAWRKRAEDNSAVKVLEVELADAVAAKRQESVAIADAALGQALDEYHLNCLQAARALRKVLNAQYRSANTPGASSNLQGMRLHLFNLPSLMPMSWTGTLGETMISGAAPFETDSRFEEAA